MPQVIVGAALAGVVAGAGSVLVVGFSLTAFAGSLILGGLSYALTPKPKKPALSQGMGNNVAVRQSDLSRKHVYGHARITTGYAHMHSTGVNKDLHLILMLCEGELRSINEIWVNDYAIPSDWIDEQGNVTEGRYKDNLVIRRHLGSPNQLADPLAVSNIDEWTNAHRLQGIAYLYLILTKDQDVYPTGVPNFSAIVEGKPVYDPRKDANVWTTNAALFSADYLTNQRYGFGVLPEDIDMANVAAQANICDEMVDTKPLSKTVSELGEDTSILTISGDMLEYQYGDRVRFTTTDGFPDGIEADTDYFVIPYQVKDTPRIMIAETFEKAMARDFVVVSGEWEGTITITKNAEPRYHASGVIETETSLSENLNNLVNSMAGRAINVGGYWTLLAGAWRSPTVEYGVGDIRGNGMSFRSTLPMAESYNVVKGLFISPLSQYQPTDYPAAKYQQFIEQDNDIISEKEMNLPFTTRPSTAQRIAKIELFRGRQGIVFSADFSTKTLQNQPGDNIYLNIDRLGWEQKPFEITEYSFDIADGGIVTKMTLRETAQQIFDWSQGEALDFDPAPNTNLPNPYIVLAPTGVGYNSRYIETREGDAVYTMTLQWDLHPDQFVVQFGDFEVQYKLSSETEWRPSFFVDGALTKTDVLNSSVNISYDLRIRARNNLGVRSGWVTIIGAVVGSSGGVTTTNDWETYSDPTVHYQDWGTFSDPVTITDDWGYYT